jgi:hypothetical protein
MESENTATADNVQWVSEPRMAGASRVPFQRMALEKTDQTIGHIVGILDMFTSFQLNGA